MSVTSYIHTQGWVAAFLNVVINSLITWLNHRGVKSVPLTGNGSVVIDLVITTIVLSFLVSLFVSRGTRREVDAGHLAPTDGPPEAGRVLSRMSRRWWALGLQIGVGVAVVAFVVVALIGALGLNAVPMVGLVVFMAVYTGVLGYAVTQWVILRQLAPHPKG